MKPNVIALSAAVALITGAAQAQDTATATATATVNLRAEVEGKCFFGRSGEGATETRNIDFDDITEVVGYTDMKSLSDTTGGVLKLTCTTPVGGGTVGLDSKSGGYLTPDAAAASAFDDNRKILYSMTLLIEDSSSGVEFFSVGDNLRSSGGRVDFYLDNLTSEGSTNADINIYAQALGGKNPDGTYKYLAGVYSDVVTVTFTPGS